VKDRDSLPSGVDPRTPNDARIYDFALGGKDNFAADRSVAEALFAANPVRSIPQVEDRRFMRRAVRFMLSQGIRQFVDLGCGMPGRGNVHEIVHAVDPAAKVAYVDYDPVAVTHYNALLSSTETAVAIHADVRIPNEILKHPEVTALIDFDRPVGLLMISLLVYVLPSEDPYGIVAKFRDQMAPGSHVALSHYTNEGKSPEELAALEAVLMEMREVARLRSLDEVTGFFDGFELLEPGVVTAPDWRPDRQHDPASGWMIAGVGKLPGPAQSSGVSS
jgi:hypothetical protein